MCIQRWYWPGHCKGVKSSAEALATILEEDTDLLVLCRYYTVKTVKNVYYRSENTKIRQVKNYDVSAMYQAIGPETSSLLIMQAITGWDKNN